MTVDPLDPVGCGATPPWIRLVILLTQFKSNAHHCIWLFVIFLLIFLTPDLSCGVSDYSPVGGLFYWGGPLVSKCQSHIHLNPKTHNFSAEQCHCECWRKHFVPSCWWATYCLLYVMGVSMLPKRQLRHLTILHIMAYYKQLPQKSVSVSVYSCNPIKTS